MYNILDFTLEELQNWMKENGESAFRAKQVFSWIYKEVWTFDEMKNIPGSLKEKLKENFTIEIPKIIEVYESNVDGTKKMLLSMKDNNLIECVLMKYKHGNSICVSTQVGCRMGCKFCASTIGGRIRDLSSGEILSEIMVAQKFLGERISNVVLMGSGEPLDNYDNVIKFLNLVIIFLSISSSFIMLFSIIVCICSTFFCKFSFSCFFLVYILIKSSSDITPDSLSS